MKKALPLVLFLVLFVGKVRAQDSLYVTPLDSILNPLESIIQSLVGEGIEVSDVQLVTGAPIQCGSYADTMADGSAGPSGTRAGLIMTTGNALVAKGPNNSGAAGQAANTPGFGLLNSLLPANATTLDACVISFKIRTSSDAIAFDYVFGSEEYNSFVGSTFNDIFALFITGPGIVTQPGLPAHTRNLAIIPGTTDTPVSINNVNKGFGNTQASFPEYYINNGALPLDQPLMPQPADSVRLQRMQYDGITAVLTAFSPVQPCQEYTLTFAVGDVGDRIYDSGVFIEAGSLRSAGNEVGLASQYPTHLNYAVASCAPGTFVFRRAAGDAGAVEKIARFEIVGTAVNGVDYIVNGGPLPDSVVIPAGTDSVEVLVKVLATGNTDDEKTIVLIQQDACSGEVQGDTAVLVLRQKLLYEVEGATLCLGDAGFQLNVDNPSAPTPTDGGSSPFVYAWSPAAGLSCTDCESPLASPDTTTLYTLTVLEPLSGCVTTAEALVNILTTPTLAPAIILNNQELSITNDSVLSVHWFRNDTLVGTEATFMASQPGLYTARFVNTCGAGAVSNAILVNLTSNQIVYASRLRVYPNPATKQLRVSGWESAWSGPRVVTLYDALGRKVRQVQARGLSAELDIASLPVGVYSVQVQEGTRIQTEKVIIRR